MFPKVNAGTEDQLDKRVAAFFLENGVPFVKVESPSFLELVRDLCAYDGTYKPPSRRTLSGKLLDECEEKMSAKLKTVIMSRNNHGCTLVTDGWTSNTKAHMLNYLTIQPAGVKFESAVCTDGPLIINSELDANWIKDEVSRVINEIGQTV
jgi:hypothetical protein